MPNKPVPDTKTSQGSSWLNELYGEFAPAREEVRDRGYSEEEINSMIDDAVREARTLARAWSDVPWEEIEAGLYRIRHESKPTPPIELPDA